MKIKIINGRFIFYQQDFLCIFQFNYSHNKANYFHHFEVFYAGETFYEQLKFKIIPI